MTLRLSVILVFATACALGQEMQPTIPCRSQERRIAGCRRGRKSGQPESSNRAGRSGGSSRLAGSHRYRGDKGRLFPNSHVARYQCGERVDRSDRITTAEGAEEKVTVYATRNDVRVQDSPLHVEVISQEEINEELVMRSSDISMLLNEMGGMRVRRRHRQAWALPVFGSRVCSDDIRRSCRIDSPVRTAGCGAGPIADSSDGSCSDRSH